MENEYEPTRESYLGTIVRLTEELNAVIQERDAALAVLKSAHEQLERYYNSSDGERDAYEYQDELEACDDAWIKLRARINGEVE